jgi:hypothetical protein
VPAAAWEIPHIRGRPESVEESDGQSLKISVENGGEGAIELHDREMETVITTFAWCSFFRAA